VRQPLLAQNEHEYKTETHLQKLVERAIRQGQVADLTEASQSWNALVRQANAADILQDVSNKKEEKTERTGNRQDEVESLTER
jgi:hypothetical protein